MATQAWKILTGAALFAGAAALLPACSQEVSHTESDKQGLFGGEKHTEDTTYQNPDGTLTHEHEETKVQ